MIRDIGGITRPRHHQPPLVEQQTEFAPDNPAMVGEAFAADLPGAAAFADGMDQLDAVGVNDAEDRRGGQEGLRPVVMGREETKEPGPLGQAGEQGPIVARQPPRERPVAPAFEREQKPQGDDRAGTEVRLRVRGDGAPLRIDFLEQRGEKLHGHHTARLSSQGCHAFQRGRVVGRLQAQNLND